MPTQQLINTPILINQYPIVVTPKPVINNNDASSIKKSNVVPFSVKDNFLYIGGAIFGMLFFIYKNRKY